MRRRTNTPETLRIYAVSEGSPEGGFYQPKSSPAFQAYLQTTERENVQKLCNSMKFLLSAHGHDRMIASPAGTHFPLVSILVGFHSLFIVIDDAAKNNEILLL